MFDLWLILIVLGIVGLYTLQSALFCFGLLRRRPRRSSYEPVVSIIVAARNEEYNLPALFESFRQLDYPPEKTEIFIVDDGSQDRTWHISEEFANTDARSRLLRAQRRISTLNGKANAIDTAVHYASGDILFVTDADCRVPSGWLRSHLKYYQDGVGMVGGFVLPEQRAPRTSLFERLQSLDWLYLCAVGAGAAGLGMALSIFGNNFSFRKNAYLQVEGFVGAGFSVIEDFALMRTMQRTGWQIALHADPDMLVETAPARSAAAFYHQRKRWVLGGRGISLFGLYALTLGFASKIAPILALIFIEPVAALAIFFWLALMDFVVSAFAAIRVRRASPLRVAPLHFAFAMLYSISFAPLFFMAKSVVWKGRNYSA